MTVSRPDVRALVTNLNCCALVGRPATIPPMSARVRRHAALRLRLPAAASSKRMGAMCSLALLCGCAAVYPEMKTPVSLPPEGRELSPPPPEDLYFIRFDGAVIPRTTLDGRPWPGDGPDPFARLLVNDKVILLTPVESGSRRPTWSGQPRENHRIAPDSKLRVEMWDSNPGPDHPLCIEQLDDLASLRGGRRHEIRCVSGARLFLVVEKARPMFGTGLYYELRGSDGVRITRVVPESPAGRAGLQSGDRVFAIEGRPVDKMSPLEVRSTITKYVRSGLTLTIGSEGGGRREVTLQEGPIYPLRGDDIRLAND